AVLTLPLMLRGPGMVDKPRTLDAANADRSRSMNGNNTDTQLVPSGASKFDRLNRHQPDTAFVGRVAAKLPRRQHSGRKRDVLELGFGAGREVLWKRCCSFFGKWVPAVDANFLVTQP
ncbi:unnamed protein product, partial [Symbiodinium pilosum]